MGAFTQEQMATFQMGDYYSLKGQTAVVTGGATGLGLAITRSVVLMHHGAIRVDSVEGEGSTFMVRIPLKNSFLKFRRDPDPGICHFQIEELMVSIQRYPDPAIFFVILDRILHKIVYRQ